MKGPHYAKRRLQLTVWGGKKEAGDGKCSWFSLSCLGLAMQLCNIPFLSTELNRKISPPTDEHMLQ